MNAQPRHLVWQVYAESDTYEILIGVAETLILLLLAFRRTALIGAIFLLPIIINNFSLALVFESCNLYQYITLLSLLLAVIIFRLPDLTEWIKEQKFPRIFQFKPSEYRLFYGAMSILKLIAIIGFMMQWLWSVDRYRSYNMWAKNHPMVGIWTVDSICTQTSEFPEFDKLIFEQSRDAMVEVEDSLTNFKYIVDTLYNQMDLYDFWEYRSIDLKGKYHFIDSNKIEYVGRNNKDSIFLQLSKVPNSPN